jgi:2-hydroxychromene-2-carboxylate isomerase
MESVAARHISFKEHLVTYFLLCGSGRQLVRLVPTVLVATLVITGGMNLKTGEAATAKVSQQVSTAAPVPATQAVPAVPANSAVAVPTPAAGGTAVATALPGPETAEAPGPESKAPKIKYLAGEDPRYAKRCGWPLKLPSALPGSILPQKRIVAYYGNPLSKRMGALGEYQKDEMLRRLHGEVVRWEKADPSLPVQPALQLVTVVAQGKPGKAGKYRMVMPDKIVNQVYDWAKEAKALFILDIQTGHDNLRTLLPRFEWVLKNPDVHLAIDPEFNLIKSGRIPGKKIGTYDAADVNYASAYLQGLVKKYDLPPKVLIVHRFTRKMVTNSKNIVLRPEVQIVMNMDGWGAPWLKRDSYKDYIVSEPVEYTGFKLFYHNDTKKGDPLLTPQEVLRLTPRPLYIQYQ